MWLIVRQLSINAGLWDVPLMPQDFSWSNEHGFLGKNFFIYKDDKNKYINIIYVKILHRAHSLTQALIWLDVLCELANFQTNRSSGKFNSIFWHEMTKNDPFCFVCKRFNHVPLFANKEKLRKSWITNNSSLFSGDSTSSSSKLPSL